MGSYEQTMLKLEQMAAANTAKQMNWQENMSKTSHQMEVNDLVAAGLNPVLSANQGANSYTTSVDSAVNGIASMASAREGANATRFAARQSAAATRAAAAAQLAAAKYSADQAYAAAKYTTDNSKSGTAWGVLSTIANKALGDPKVQGIIASLKGVTDNARKNPENVLKNQDLGFRYSNFTQQGKKQVWNALGRFGLKDNSTNRNLYIDAFYNRDKSAMTKFVGLLRANNKKKSSASALGRMYNY